jgi:subtilisin family serine protease
VEVEKLELHEVRGVSQGSGVLGVAPIIPMRLLQPVKRVKAKKQQAGIAWGISAVGADTALHDGEGITVAVLDTGIERDHPAFADPDLEIVEADFTGEGNGDFDGHGTHCAGTIFGRDVDGFRIGVARGVKRALIGKVLGQNGGSSLAIINAMNWAVENGADIISMSLGIDFPGLVKQLVDDGYPTEVASSEALNQFRINVRLFDTYATAIKARSAFGKPVLILGAAGNESNIPDYRIAVSPPAVAEGFISVAALGDDNGKWEIASFSNNGAFLSGPGVDIVSAGLGGGLETMSGTSMATPHVAGVAAIWAGLLKSRGDFNLNEISHALTSSTTLAKMKAGFDRTDVGLGMVTAPQDPNPRPAAKKAAKKTAKKAPRRGAND